jgi:hypothetical protein
MGLTDKCFQAMNRTWCQIVLLVLCIGVSWIPQISGRDLSKYSERMFSYANKQYTVFIVSRPSFDVRGFVFVGGYGLEFRNINW